MLNLEKSIIYDIESYPNLFSIAYCKSDDFEKRKIFYISPRINQYKEIYGLLEKLENKGWSMIGFNNVDFDWIVLDWMYARYDELAYCSGAEASYKINTFVNYWFNTLQENRDSFFEYRKANNLWVNRYKIPQIDLYKIHRLDAVKIGLKTIQFNMGFPSIRTLPYEPNTYLDDTAISEVLDYNMNNDVHGTQWFYKKSLNEINFRNTMGDALNKYLMSYSDVKIAELWFQQELEKKGVDCYTLVDGVRTARQTLYYDGFYLDDVLFDCIDFKTERFKKLKEWFGKQLILETKGTFTNLTDDDLNIIRPFINTDKSNIKKDGSFRKLEFIYGDLPFVLGQGGLHASVDSKYVTADDDYVILDVDVRSYYPSIIANTWKVLGKVFKVYPRHIGEIFCDIVRDVRDIRFKTDKSNPWNLMYKLILNAFTFGKLNEDSSFVKDQKALLTITINGQLMICMLVESIIEDTKLTKIIQCNTDGITLKAHKSELDKILLHTKEWQEKTGLILEESYYDFMAINDVNNYIAKYSNNQKNEKPNAIKAKGSYLTKPLWTQDFSFLIVKKAVDAYFKDGILPEDFIRNHSEYHDFLGQVKVDRRFSLLGVDIKDDDIVPTLNKLKFNKLLSLPENNKLLILNELDDRDDYIYFVSNELAKSQSIDIDDINIKELNKKLKLKTNRVNFLLSKLTDLNIKESILKSIIDLYLKGEYAKFIESSNLKHKKLLPVTAYYLSNSGFYMYKETLDEERNDFSFTGIESGFRVSDCNDMDKFDIDNVNFQWYIEKAWKLINNVSNI